MRVMLLMVVTPFLILRHSDDFRIFGEGIVTLPISNFECPRKTLCAHLIIGWCEHPPSSFIREFECQAQNTIRIPTQYYPLANQHSIKRI